MSVEDAVQAVKDEIKSRAGNPVVGTFLLAELLINWRVPVAILFGPDPKDQAKGRLEVVAGLLRTETEWEWAWRFAVYPFLLTIGYLLVSNFLGDLHFRLLERPFARRKEKALQRDARIHAERGKYGEVIHDILTTSWRNIENANSRAKAALNLFHDATNPTAMNHTHSRADLKAALEAIKQQSEQWLSSYKTHFLNNAGPSDPQIWARFSAFRESCGADFQKYFWNA